MFGGDPQRPAVGFGIPPIQNFKLARPLANQIATGWLGNLALQHEVRRQDQKIPVGELDTNDVAIVRPIVAATTTDWAPRT